MLRQRPGIAFRAQPVQEPRRPLDVGENEGDGPRRQSLHVDRIRPGAEFSKVPPTRMRRQGQRGGSSQRSRARLSERGSRVLFDALGSHEELFLSFTTPDEVALHVLAVPVDGGKPLSFHMIEIFIFNPGGELVNFKFDQRGECV